MKLHTILMQKTKAASVMKDSEKEFGVVCLDYSMPETETKELTGNDWLDEDGDDTFIPENIKEKATKMEISVGYKGPVSEWEEKLDRFMDYLTGHDGTGVELMIYMPYHHTGRVCRMTKVPKPQPCFMSKEVVIEMKIEFAIDSPRDRISLNKDLDGTITSLTRRKR